MQTRSQKRKRIEFPIQGRIYIYKSKRKIVPIYLEEDIQEESYTMMASVLEESGVNEFKKKKQFKAQVQLIQLPFCTDKFLQKNGSVFRLESRQFQEVKEQIEQAKQEMKKQGNENKKQKIDQSVVIENK